MKYVTSEKSIYTSFFRVTENKKKIDWKHDIKIRSYIIKIIPLWLSYIEKLLLELFTISFFNLFIPETVYWQTPSVAT